MSILISKVQADLPVITVGSQAPSLCHPRAYAAHTQHCNFGEARNDLVFQETPVFDHRMFLSTAVVLWFQRQQHGPVVGTSDNGCQFRQGAARPQGCIQDKQREPDKHAGCCKRLQTLTHVITFNFHIALCQTVLICADVKFALLCNALSFERFVAITGLHRQHFSRRLGQFLHVYMTVTRIHETAYFTNALLISLCEVFAVEEALTRRDMGNLNCWMFSSSVCM